MSEESTSPIEEMASFLDFRASGYDDYIRGYAYTETELQETMGMV